MALCVTALKFYVTRVKMSFQGLGTYATATVAVCMVMTYHLAGTMALTARARLRFGTKTCVAAAPSTTRPAVIATQSMAMAAVVPIHARIR